MSADTRLIVSELDEVKGLIVASACGVGGIFQSPGVGRGCGGFGDWRPSSLPMDVLRAGRFAGQFEDDAQLRSRCEDVYARMYLSAVSRFDVSFP